MESTFLKEFIILCSLTIGATQVYKEIFSNAQTQKVSVCIAMLISSVTGSGILTPLGFAPASIYIEQFPILQTIFTILFYVTDLILTGLLASKGSNYIVDLLKGNLVSMGSK